MVFTIFLHLMGYPILALLGFGAGFGTLILIERLLT
jgi:hypothetical protein